MKIQSYLELKKSNNEQVEKYSDNLNNILGEIEVKIKLNELTIEEMMKDPYESLDFKFKLELENAELEVFKNQKFYVQRQIEIASIVLEEREMTVTDCRS